ncbi:hypothetical protein NDU88_005482 [Pleurodeles waltl]|uniref:Uncharacterized protein n=1 Tax=Pleurodeles waltl TaxID=8319 RepID=A0AAV7TB67_PLEWA|nr:hypothetical protein NDU88_005482 [Pleurodeles waltl]
MRQSAIRQPPGPAQEALKRSGASTHLGSELWSIPTTREGAPRLMSLLHSFICQVRRLYLLDRGVLPVLSLLTSPEAITRPSSGSLLLLR